MTTERRIKKSAFSGKSAMVSTDTLDFVRDGQNFKITFEAFLQAIAATGTIEQLGESTGVAVLTKDATINYIRGILAGSGIIAELSVENGIELSHNFANDSTGAELLSGINDAQPVFRSIVAGSGISVAEEDDHIQIALSATPVTTKTVIVNEITDFPTAVSGVITLEDEIQYLVTNDITTSNRFVIGSDTVLTGSDGALIALTYSGTGTMITSVSNSNKIKDVTLTCATGTLLDVSCATGVSVFQLIGCRLNCATIGTIDGVYVANFENIIWSVTTDGVTFLNDNSIISFSKNIGAITTGKFVDFGTSTFDGFTFVDSFGVLSTGTTFLSGLADSGNVNTGGLATVINTRALGTGTALENITTKDSLWEFALNSGMDNSRDSILAVHSGATITIATIDTPVIIGATWSYSQESRFEGTAGGRITYTGKGAHISITAAISAVGAVVQTRDFEFLLYKNGSAISGASFSRSFDSSASGSLSIVWQDDLDTDDYLELWVQNTESADNIVINSVQLGIS